MQLTIYIIKHYLIYISIILFSLIIFFVYADYISNVKYLPDSANIKFLYIAYKSFYAFDLLLPISLIFALITTKIKFIKNNFLIAIYSLGYNKKDVLLPFLVSAMIITLLKVLLNFTPLTYSYEKADSLTRLNNKYAGITYNLFFKYKDYYIYFNKLYPSIQKAKNIRIFKINDRNLVEVLNAKKANYKDYHWTMQDVNIIIKPKEFSIKNSKIKIIKEKEIKILKGFRPNILDQIYEGKVSFNIIDAIESIILLKSQGININKIKTSLYGSTIYPFFAPFLIIIVFYLVPLSSRFIKVSLFGFIAIITSLMVWGFLFALFKFTSSQVISPEYGIILPVFIILLISIFFWIKEN